MSRRLLAATAATALIAPLGASLGSPASSAPAAAADSSSPLKVLAPTTSRAESYDGQVYFDSLATLKAQNGPLEIRAHRTSWWTPITGEWKRPGGDVPLPDGAMKSFSGLTDFARLTVRKPDGTLVRQLSVDGCLNGSSQRLSPDGAAHSEYPDSCPMNPFTKGSVMGIEDGWGMQLGAYTSVRLTPGKYDVTVSIRPTWKKFFKITAADSSATTRLTVVRGSGEYRRTTPPRRTVTPMRPAASEPTRSAAGETGPRPDLQPLPAWNLRLSGNKKLLQFAANVWNAGDSPLVLDGYRDPDEDHMTAYQYFFDADDNQVGYQQVGELHFHAANHNHWHFEDFARYRLYNADKQPIRRSMKQSFCLAATDAIDYTVPGADWHPYNTDLATACGGPSALAIREVLQSGNGDTYSQERYGQAINIDGLPNGIYYVAVEANPFSTLIESNTANNRSLRRFKLMGSGDNRRIVVPQLGLIDESVWGENW